MNEKLIREACIANTKMYLTDIYNDILKRENQRYRLMINGLGFCLGLAIVIIGFLIYELN